MYIWFNPIYIYTYMYRVSPGLTHRVHLIECTLFTDRYIRFNCSVSYSLHVHLEGSVTKTPAGISAAPLQYPHPAVGRASVGARASCLPSERTRVRSARRGCH